MNLPPKSITAYVRSKRCGYGYTVVTHGVGTSGFMRWAHEVSGWELVATLACVDEFGRRTGQAVKWNVEPVGRCREIECDYCHS